MARHGITVTEDQVRLIRYKRSLYNRIDRLTYQSVYRVFIALFLCTASLASYAVIMLTKSNLLPIKKNTKLDKEDISYEFPKKYIEISDSSTVIALSLSSEEGKPLYCEKCKTFKPERTHHCRECQRCAPKMDQ
jgi:nucleosome binding factor SPN SPT16 subunit